MVLRRNDDDDDSRRGEQLAIVSAAEAVLGVELRSAAVLPRIGAADNLTAAPAASAQARQPNQYTHTREQAERGCQRRQRHDRRSGGMKQVQKQDTHHQ